MVEIKRWIWEGSRRFEWSEEWEFERRGCEVAALILTLHQHYSVPQRLTSFPPCRNAHLPDFTGEQLQAESEQWI